jgi:hypothetical protein
MAQPLTRELFWSRVSFGAPGECALYIGPGVETSSGHVRIAAFGTKHYSHRVAFYFTHGWWPVYVCHECDIPRCQIHLYAGDAATNAEDRDRRGRRTPFLLRRPEHPASKLTARDIDELIEARAMGIRAATLAQEYCVSQETVRSVWRRAAIHMPIAAAA